MCSFSEPLGFEVGQVQLQRVQFSTFCWPDHLEHHDCLVKAVSLPPGTQQVNASREKKYAGEVREEERKEADDEDEAEKKAGKKDGVDEK